MNPLDTILHAFARTLDVLASAQQASEVRGSGWLPPQNKGQFCALVRAAIEDVDKPQSGADPQSVVELKYQFNRYADTYKVPEWETASRSDP